MRARFLFAIGVLLGVAHAEPAARTKSGETHLVHISQLQRRMWASDEANSTVMPFGLSALPESERPYRIAPSGPKPSAFERGLLHFWRTKDIVPDQFGFDRKQFPTRAPWGRPERSNHHFDETQFFRAAVIETVSGWADKNGYVDMSKIKAKFGTTPREQQILSTLSHPISKTSAFRPGSAMLGDFHAYLDQRTLRKVTRSQVDGLIPKDMHALSFVRQRYDKDKVGDSMVRVWARQHLLGNTLGFLDAMGVPPGKTDVWGKVYSLDPRIGSAMVDRGFGVHAGDLDPREVEAQVAAEIAKIPDPAAIKKPQFLVLDDGGELIATIAAIVQKKYPAYAHLFTAVEQTQGGINRVENMKLPFPVVASGSSWGKREHGSAMFGYAVSREIESKLGKLPVRNGVSLASARKITVLGYGEIGSTIARHFRENGFEVTVFDPDAAKLARATKDGMHATSDQHAALASSPLLVSAAGRTSMKHEDFAYVPDGAVVFNAASSNELPRIGAANGGLPMPGEPSYSESRDTIHRFALPDPKDPDHTIAKALLFVKDGGVINFPLEVDNPRAGQLVPGRYIQYQLGLLYLDVVHAMKGGLAPGLAKSPVAPQKALTKVVQAQLAQTGESLDAPKWD